MTRVAGWKPPRAAVVALILSRALLRSEVLSEGYRQIRRADILPPSRRACGVLGVLGWWGWGSGWCCRSAWLRWRGGRGVPSRWARRVLACEAGLRWEALPALAFAGAVASAPAPRASLSRGLGGAAFVRTPLEATLGVWPRPPRGWWGRAWAVAAAQASAAVRSCPRPCGGAVASRGFAPDAFVQR